MLLALAYALYRWGTASSAAARQYNADDRQYSDADRQYNEDYSRTAAAAAAAEPDGAVITGKQGLQQESGDGEESGEGFYEPSYEPGFSGVGLEGLGVPGVGVEAGYVAAEESEVQEADKVRRCVLCEEEKKKSAAADA